MSRLGRTTPCFDCPWRRKATPGWLGADEPVPFVTKTVDEVDMPCHTEIDYSDPDWEETQAPDASHCAGGLIFLRNVCKMPRDPELADAVRAVEPDARRVFATPAEFLAHHLGRDIDRAEAARLLDAERWGAH